ncbi:MAG: ParA family protein [Bacillota bacterium]
MRKDYLNNYVIIDCPPNLSILTVNAILASDYYVVPVIPEELSTFGLRLIQRRIGELKELYPDDVKIEFAGAVLNRVDMERRSYLLLREID